MEEKSKSKGEQAIERLMTELDPASERYQVLDSARRFKSSWVELGGKLLEVQRSATFQGWGYGSFEEYCAREVRIRRQTAQKLTHAFRFLEKEEPDLLVRRTELRPLPDFRSIDLLRQAHEELHLPPQEYAGLRRAVLEEERSHPTVQRRFREAADAHGPAPPPSLPLKAALAAARRLQGAMANLSGLPPEHAAAIDGLVRYLEGSLQAES